MKEVLIGVIFVASLSIVLYFAFHLGGTGSLSAIFQGDDMRTIRIRFSEVTGLTVRNDVLVSGVREGSVTIIELQGDGSVIVVARIRAKASIFNDATCEMINISPLGGKAIAISPGSAATSAIDPDKIIEGEYVQDFLRAAARAMTKIERGIDNAPATVEDVRDMIADVKAGRGPIGMLLRDQETAESIRQTAASLSEASENLRNVAREVDHLIVQINSGKGAISRALYDERLGEDFSRTMEHVRNTTAEAESLAADLRRMAEKIERGEGVVGDLINNPETRDTLRRAIRDLDEAVIVVKNTFVQGEELLQGIKDGRGSIGKLFTDDTLHNDIVRAVNTLQAGFEDIREQAPVTTFASVIFQAFQ